MDLEFSDEYDYIICSELNDLLYAKDNSNRSKEKAIRSYLEVVIRFLIDDSLNYVTLGNKNVIEELKTKTHYFDEYLKDLLDVFNLEGNIGTHTFNKSKVTDEKINDLLNRLDKIYAYIFIEYFSKYRFGTNDFIVGLFSLLPPKIRFYTLDFLRTKDKQNKVIIDKYVLAMLKTYSYAETMEWIELNKDYLSSVLYVSNSEYEILKNIPGLPLTMYDYELHHISDTNLSLGYNPIKYKTFEDAKVYYEKIMPDNVDTQELAEFKKRMDFCFRGRNKNE